MTIPEFLEKLKQTPRTWELSKIRKIVRNDMWQCPLSSLCGLGSSGWKIAEKELGLNHADGSKILHAADNDDGYNSELRSQLLAACGLS